MIDDNGAKESYISGSNWVVLSGDDKFFDNGFFEGGGGSVIERLGPTPGFRGWGDDFSNIVSIIK